METETILNTALFSGILGFVAFCASYAWHVWRSRNAAGRPSSSSTRSGRLLRWSLVSIGVGVVLLGVALIWREVRPREGVLLGEGLYTARADDDLELESVTAARHVERGEVLARFRSPERQAEIDTLDLKLQILQVQKQIVQLQPLTPDSELVRSHERAIADQRQLVASLTYLLPEHALIVRERLRDKLDKTERLNSLTTRIESTRRELDQAQARLKLEELHLARTRNLSADAAAPAIELEERVTGASVARGEVARLTGSIANLERERRHVQDSVPAFAVCTSQQAEEIDRELQRVQSQLHATTEQLQASKANLEEDRRRAGLLKEQMLAQLELEIRQCRAKLEGVRNTLVVKAPWKGAIVYADAAPSAALPMAPVVVLAPERGFRFRLRMAEAEARALEKTGSVTLGLVVPILQRRFAGRLLESEPLPCEPGYVLAELGCLPPSETIRDLVAHGWGAQDWATNPASRMRLLWRPPLHVLPLFQVAACVLAVGGIGLCAAWLVRARSRAGRGTPSPELSTGAPAGRGLPSELTSALQAVVPALEASDLEAGALGRNLTMLGQRFREAIQRQEIEPALLRALEWALDRHQARAIRHLAEGMDHDPELEVGLIRLIDSAVSESQDGSTELPETVDRVVRIIQALAPDVWSRVEGKENRHRVRTQGSFSRPQPATRPSVFLKLETPSHEY
ncbi:MAG: hypothetical protein AMXMBFR13_10100 [Phycisphaerae bacterium]